tara:strand:- start:8434 stop:8805 length:372 start_codon:yes stop_codon:yes gene_type:complete
MIRTTLICPEPLIADANALASALGDSPSDAQSFGEAIWVDGGGRRFAVASLVSARLPGGLLAPLAEPGWTVDMAAAARAQAAVTIMDPADSPGDPERLRVLSGMSVSEALGHATLAMDQTLFG